VNSALPAELFPENKYNLSVQGRWKISKTCCLLLMAIMFVWLKGHMNMSKTICFEVSGQKVKTDKMDA
jgi:hypothetical protein